MTGLNSIIKAENVPETSQAEDASSTKAALILAVSSIALTGAFVAISSGFERHELTWLMPLGSSTGLIFAAQSMRAMASSRLDWLVGGTIALASAAALAVGVISPLQVIISAGSLVTGIAVARGYRKYPDVNNAFDMTMDAGLGLAEKLSGRDIVQCDVRSKIIATGNAKFEAGLVLLECVHIADRPAFLLGLSHAANAHQTLKLRMRTEASEHYAATEIKITMLDRKLFVSMAALNNQAAEKQANDTSREIAHELRTPLAAIVGLADALDQGKTCTQEMRATYPALIARAGRSLIELTSTILETSTDIPVRPQVKLGIVARECIDLLQPNANQKSITLFNRVPEKLADKMVDGVALRQILINLVSNAVKFSPAGTSAEISAVVSANGWTLSVADSGDGIAPEDVARLGQKNFRGEKTAGIAGFGLGLSIVRRLVDEMGARISFESRPGKGTKVTIAFPAATLVDFADFQTLPAFAEASPNRFNDTAGAKHAAA